MIGLARIPHPLPVVTDDIPQHPPAFKSTDISKSAVCVRLHRRPRGDCRGPTERKRHLVLVFDSLDKYNFDTDTPNYQQLTAVCFTDFVAAFDSVHRESLWRIMELDGVPAKIIAMIKAYYRSPIARVLVRNNLSQPFGIRSGVRQGCILSPILFNYAIDWILGRALHAGDGVEFAPGHRLTDLDYADDIALLASSFGNPQSMVSRVNEVAKSVGLSINAGKTKVFSSCIPDQKKAPLGIDGCQFEGVDSFKYLGARLLPNGQRKDDIVSESMLPAGFSQAFENAYRSDATTPSRALFPYF
ncbi:hypothetical protein SprV_0702278600 [Sparganum proliferum]